MGMKIRDDVRLETGREDKQGAEGGGGGGEVHCEGGGQERER
jgi:hypothetical protein